jgi:hypothetical protein
LQPEFQLGNHLLNTTELEDQSPLVGLPLVQGHQVTFSLVSFSLFCFLQPPNFSKSEIVLERFFHIVICHCHKQLLILEWDFIILRTSMISRVTLTFQVIKWTLNHITTISLNSHSALVLVIARYKQET